jgi:cytoskeletal protein RodZ
MENLMNKVANDLQNYAPQAPAGMEDRIQKALNKKKSFWSFSWYSMNVYLVALVGAGVLALVFSNSSERNAVAQNSTPAVAEVKAAPSTVVDLNAKNNAILNVENEVNSAPVKTARRSKIVQEETSVSTLVVENCQSTPIVEPVIVEVAETIEVQRMPEEIQVPYPKKEVVKAKGRTLKLTRLTGK